MKQRRISISVYILADLVVSILTWILFYYLRPKVQGYPFWIPPGFYIGLLLYCAGWVILYFLSGTYTDLYQKSRVAELLKTFSVTLAGCFVLLFFFVLKNPQVNNYNYYADFFLLLGPQFLLIAFIRLLIISYTKTQIKRAAVFFNTLLVSSGDPARKFLEDFKSTEFDSGYRLVQILDIDTDPGIADELPALIKKLQIEDVILAVDPHKRELSTKILQQLSDTDVNVRLTPDTLDILSGRIKPGNIMGLQLINVHYGELPPWQQNIKRMLDIFFALTGGLIISPFFIYAVLRLKLSEGGPVFFAQERIGFRGRPFRMYKLRTMIPHAEPGGPRLSSENDERITRWGKVLRKWRLDELPQIWNILRGDMSVVGPRPERKFYADILIANSPEYRYLFKVKPGLTSWGMVKFGYASNPAEMAERMQYDLLYVENVSLVLDLKIMLHSIRIIFSGKGK